MDRADTVALVSVLLLIVVLVGLVLEWLRTQRIRDPWVPVRRWQDATKAHPGYTWVGEATYTGEGRVERLAFVESGLDGALDWCEMQASAGATRLEVFLSVDPRLEIEGHPNRSEQ